MRTLERTRGRATLAILTTILFLTFLDNTIVSVILAGIQSDLSAGVSALQWVVNSYALTFAALMLTFGTFGDMFGRKRVMLGGVAVFCAGSAIAALAPNVNVLLAGRIVMGVGAAASEPGTLSMIRQLYTDRQERARALGVWAAVSGLALALGPVIGGALAGFSSWRAVFWFNLGFGLLALGAAAAILPESADPEGRRVDLPGVALGVVALVTGIYGVIAGENAGYQTWWIDVLFAVSVVAGIAFVLVERRTSRPVLDVRLFRRPAFTGANLVVFATFFGIFAIFFFVALYLQLIANASPYATALDFLPMAAGMIAASAFTGRWVARSGPRLPMTVGCILGAAGILLTNAYLSPNVGLATLGWTLGIAGIGFGIAMVPVTAAILTVAPAERSGMAASVGNTSRELGAVFGVAVLGAVINAELTGHLVTQLQRLGIPANFQALVLHAVTHGGVPKTGPAGFGHSRLVMEVIHAAEAAFASGLNVALLLAGAMLAAGALLAAVTIRRTSEPASLLGAPPE